LYSPVQVSVCLLLSKHIIYGPSYKNGSWKVWELFYLLHGEERETFWSATVLRIPYEKLQASKITKVVSILMLSIVFYFGFKSFSDGADKWQYTADELQNWRLFKDDDDDSHRLRLWHPTIGTIRRIFWWDNFILRRYNQRLDLWNS